MKGKKVNRYSGGRSSALAVSALSRIVISTAIKILVSISLSSIHD
jgi:hypothetical protein